MWYQYYPCDFSTCLVKEYYEVRFGSEVCALGAQHALSIVYCTDGCSIRTILPLTRRWIEGIDTLAWEGDAGSISTSCCSASGGACWAMSMRPACTWATRYSSTSSLQKQNYVTGLRLNMECCGSSQVDLFPPISLGEGLCRPHHWLPKQTLVHA